MSASASITVIGVFSSWLKKFEDDIMTDDEFCENLYQHYLNSKAKDESYTLEECKKNDILILLFLINGISRCFLT